MDSPLQGDGAAGTNEHELPLWRRPCRLRFFLLNFYFLLLFW